jgi:hypothetical protein
MTIKRKILIMMMLSCQKTTDTTIRSIRGMVRVTWPPLAIFFICIYNHSLDADDQDFILRSSPKKLAAPRKVVSRNPSPRGRRKLAKPKRTQLHVEGQGLADFRPLHGISFDIGKSPQKDTQHPSDPLLNTPPPVHEEPSTGNAVKKDVTNDQSRKQDTASEHNPNSNPQSLTQELGEENFDDELGPDDFPPPFASGQTTPAESDFEDEADRILKHRFMPMTDPNEFIKALTKLSPSERSMENLLALALNTQEALRAWQDEYLELDKRVSHDKPI